MNKIKINLIILIIFAFISGFSFYMINAQKKITPEEIIKKAQQISKKRISSIITILMINYFKEGGIDSRIVEKFKLCLKNRKEDPRHVLKLKKEYLTHDYEFPTDGDIEIYDYENNKKYLYFKYSNRLCIDEDISDEIPKRWDVGYDILTEFKYTMLKDEKLNNRLCYVLEGKPIKEDFIIKYIKVWIDKKDFIFWKSEYITKDNMKSLMEFLDQIHDVEIPDSEFTPPDASEVFPCPESPPAPSTETE